MNTDVLFAMMDVLRLAAVFGGSEGLTIPEAEMLAQLAQLPTS